jgi:uncharacterized protein
MTVLPTAPGVYIQELPSDIRAITGVSTSLTAFVGPALRGPVGQPTRIASWSEFETRFGGLWVHSPMSQVVRHYFVNGGAEALIVRVVNDDAMVLAATEEAQTLAGFDQLTATVSNRDEVAGTFDLEVAAAGADGQVLADADDVPFSLTVGVDLAATPSADIDGARTTQGTHLMTVVGDPLTGPPPERSWASAGGGGAQTLTIGSRATAAAATLGVGLVLRATAAARALPGFDRLVAEVKNRDETAGTFDLRVDAVNAEGTTLELATATRGGRRRASASASAHSIELTGLDVEGDYAAQITAATTGTATPIPLVEVVGPAPAAVPPNGEVDGADAPDGTQVVVLATTSLRLEAASPGAWGDRLQALATTEEAEDGSFHLTLTELDEAGATLAEEVYYSVTTEPTGRRYLGRLLELQSQLARLEGSDPAADPAGSAGPVAFSGGDDGGDPRVTEDLQGSPADRTGLYALETADLFNLLCLPLASWSEEDGGHLGLWTAAAVFCEEHRAFLLVDPPDEWTGPTAAADSAETFTPRSDNAALYYPRVRVPDPLQENRLAEFPPCGVVAGVVARTDAQRGVWKAPAGTDATLRVPELATRLTDSQQGLLNRLGVNGLRSFPVYGRVVWGARTLKGADVLASQWKYVPVRRLALFLEESLVRGTRWAVFEGNDETLWSELRLSIGAFMHQLFRQGAFQGASPQQAYFVKCDAETTTQSDIDRGVVNVLIGFAPLKPAEFVIIKLQQLAAQAGQ